MILRNRIKNSPRVKSKAFLCKANQRH